MTRIIIFASGKGGVGKSTVTRNVATAAGEIGEEVILIDADIPMAGLILSLGLDVEGPTLHEVLSGEGKLENAIYEGPEGVDVLPTGISLDGVRKANPKRLAGVLEDISESYDTILIDAPAGLGAAALTVLRASDELVLITVPVVNSLTDALRTKEVAVRFNTEPLGVIISRTFDSDVDVPREEVENMLGIPILGVVPEDTEVRRSASIGEPVVSRKPDSASSEAFKKIAEEIFVKRKGIDYDEFVEKSVAEIIELSEEKDLNYKRLLEKEKKKNNRESLITWIETQIEKSESEE